MHNLKHETNDIKAQALAASKCFEEVKKLYGRIKDTEGPLKRVRWNWTTERKVFISRYFSLAGGFSQSPSIYIGGIIFLKMLKYKKQF